MERTPARRTGILLAVFGAESRMGENALDGFTRRIRARFPDIPVRWAFTSDRLRVRLAGNVRRKSDSVGKALRRMAFEQYVSVAVQPLHVVPGYEYEELANACEDANTVIKTSIGAPLLTSDTDMDAMARLLIRHLPADRREDDAVLIVGHGSSHPSTSLITSLGRSLNTFDDTIHTAVMKGGDTLDDILPRLYERKTRHVWMLPLLALVGHHMLMDLSGDAPSSWKTRLEKVGISCQPVLRGIAEIPAFADIWINHLATALDEAS